MPSLPEAFISASKLAELVGVSDRQAKNICRASRLNGAPIVVELVDGRGGARGKRYRVKTNSLQIALQAQLNAPASAPQKPLPAPSFNSQRPSKLVAQVDWWLHTLRSALDEEEGTPERAKAVAALVGANLLDWRGQPKRLSRTVIYRQIAKIENDGIAAVARKPRADTGKDKVILSRGHDKATGFSVEIATQLRDKLRLQVRGWLIKVATRSRVLSHLTNALVKMTLGLGFVPSDREQFRHVCKVAVRRLYDLEKAPAKQVYNYYHDRKRSDDAKPRIQRRPPQKPAECYVLDVHHINVLVRGRNGKIGTVKMLGCFDWATRRFTAEFVFFDERGGVKNIDNIEAIRNFFASPSWGVCQSLYIDNGKEYVFARFLDTLLQLNAAGRGFTSSVKASKVIRALPYNGAAKPIENGFHQLNNHEFRHCQGFIGHDRMNSMEVASGRLPEPFGTFDEFVDYARGLINAYNHHVIDSGPLAGKSPNQWFREHVEGGWKATVLDPRDFDAVFVTRKTRDLIAHAIKVDNRVWTCDELDRCLDDQVVVCIPHFHGFNELRIEDLKGEFIGIAVPDQARAWDDPRGAQTSSRRVAARNASIRDHGKSAPDIDVGAARIEWAASLGTVAANEPDGVASVIQSGPAGRAIVPTRQPKNAREKQHEDAEQVRKIRAFDAEQAKRRSAS